MPSSLNDWLARIDQLNPDDIELGLARCSAVWDRMGRPRPGARNVIVAGTNGKGSTVAGIEAGFSAMGLRAGAYTSPHLLRYNERVRLLGKEIADEALVAAFEAVEGARGDTRLTYFEFGTLAAFHAMAQARLDVAILEVGLGGRLDAVNIIDADLAVITPVGLDHQEYLGNDREQVGREKAGVLRAGQTVVCSDREPPESIFAAAGSLDARLIRIGADFDVSRDPADPEGIWRYYFADDCTQMPVSMFGSHQADNLAASLTTIVLMEPSARGKLEAVARGVGGCRVRGRLEQLRRAPDVVVDVGHNPMAARVIRDYLDDRGASGVHAVLGMLGDKDAEGVVEVLAGHVATWHCAGLKGGRGQTGEALAARVRAAAPDAEVQDYASVVNALDAAQSGVGSGLVLAFGSFLTAGESIAHIRKPS